MRSRSDRYTTQVSKPRVSRAEKNAYLYDDINNRIGLEVVDFDNAKDIDLSSVLPKTDIKDQSVLKNDDIVNVNIVEQEEKNFDINSVLAEAKKNRNEIDQLEKKRKLKNEDYNVLNDLNKKYITDKEKYNKDVNEEELQELINTITSNTLAKDIKEKELFSDLMATSSDIKIDDIETSDTGDISKVEKTEDGHLVNSFYTKSMDLSEQDFDMSDEFVESRGKLRVFLIIFVIALIVGILAVVGYFLLKWKNIV